VSSSEVLQIVLGIGGTEAMHFQTWHDKAGNAPPLTDPSDSTLVFPDLNAPPLGGEDFQTNLIMPEPNRILEQGPASMLYYSSDQHYRRGDWRTQFPDGHGTFYWQSPAFFAFLRELAEEADAARREGER